MAKHPDTLCSLQNLTVSPPIIILSPDHNFIISSYHQQLSSYVVLFMLLFKMIENIQYLYTLVSQVSLSKLGWGKTIIAPLTYEANYCAGACTFPLSKVSHHHHNHCRHRRRCHHHHGYHESGNGSSIVYHCNYFCPSLLSLIFLSMDPAHLQQY